MKRFFYSLSIFSVLLSTTAVFSQSGFSREELEEGLSHGNELIGDGQRGLADAIGQDALTRNKTGSQYICYDGTNPSSSGLGAAAA